jgi:hypothetical protein
VIRAYSGGEHDLTRSSDRGLGVCVWAHPMEYLLQVHFCGYC